MWVFSNCEVQTDTCLSSNYTPTLNCCLWIPAFNIYKIPEEKYSYVIVPKGIQSNIRMLLFVKNDFCFHTALPTYKVASSINSVSTVHANEFLYQKRKDSLIVQKVKLIESYYNKKNLCFSNRVMTNNACYLQILLSCL